LNVLLRRSFAAILPLLSFVYATAQRTIHVPADKSTIQAAIDSAVDGDTVLVAPGIYTENISFQGKGITVTSTATSAKEASSTVIQGTKDGPVVSFQSGEPSTAVLSGFTVESGFASVSSGLHGNGISISGASPQIVSNTISQNLGCGVEIEGNSSPFIRSNIISNNSYPTLAQSNMSSGCSSTSATPIQAGIGIAIVTAANAVVSNNLIENNICYLSTQTGANTVCGMYILGGNDLLVKDNIFRNNSDNFYFGSENGYVSTLLKVINNLFYNNTGLSVVQFEGTYTTTPSTATMPTVALTNNTFYNVVVSYVQDFEPSSATNNVFVRTNFDHPYDPAPVPYALLLCGAFTLNGTFMMADTNDQYSGGFPQTYFPCPLGPGNISVDPQFLADNLPPPSTDYNFRVQRTSPIIAIGDINAPDIPQTDLDGKNRFVCGKVDMGAYEKHPIPPITLASTPNPSVGGTSVSFTIGMTGNCNTPTGTVTILDGTTPIGTAVLDASGNATFSTASLFVGTHPISVSYPGDFNFDPSTSNTVNQVVTGIPTTTSLTVSPNPAQAFQSITMSATVSSNLGIPNGTVDFYAGSQLIGSATVGTNGLATTAISTLGAGTYEITATYQATIDYGASTSNQVNEVVNGSDTQVNLTSSPNPSGYTQPVAFTATVSAAGSIAVPTGTVSFQEGAKSYGTSLVSPTGSATLTLSNLSVGTHQITATYGGSSNYNTSGSNTVNQIVKPIGTMLQLDGSPNPAGVGTIVTFTANLSSAYGTPNIGTVSFSDQFGVLGTAPISAGKALLSISTLASGTHNVVASYQPAGGFDGAVSNTLSEIIQSFDFSISVPPTASMASGGSISIPITIQGIGDLPGDVLLSVSPKLQYGQLALSPTEVQFALGGAASSTLVIKAVEALSRTKYPISNSTNAHLAFLAMIFIAPLSFLFTPERIKARRFLRALPLTLLLAGSSWLSGCTEKYEVLNRLAPGTYTITISGQDKNSKILHERTITLTVK